MGLLGIMLGCVANVAVVLLVAPLGEGVLRKVTARLQSRQGPPLWQPYYDLLKLLGKEDLESGETPWVQRLAGYLALTVLLTVACLVPLGMPPPLSGAGDVVLLIYLLTLSGICTLLAGLGAGSTFSLLGMSREMMTMMTLEPLFAISLIAGSLQAGSLRLDPVLSGSVYGAAGVPWSGLILLGVMAMAFPAFVQRVPYDVAEAESEIMGGALLEYSGPKLALFKYAQMARLTIYSGLFVALFAPWGNEWVFPLGWAWFWLKVLMAILLVTVVAASHARYRVDQALRQFLRLLGLAMGALLLASYGH